MSGAASEVPSQPPVARNALVRGVFATRVADVFGLLSKIALLLAVVASGVFLAPLAGVIFGVAAVVMWSFGRRLASAFYRRTNATLTVEDGTLVVAGEGRPRRLPLSAMRSGRVSPDGNDWRTTVVVRNRAGVMLDAELNRTHARALLRDLGLSARERPMTFSFFFGMRVTVGADGILVAWPLLRRRRFVRYAEMVGVDASPGRILIRLRDGRTYEIVTTTKEDSSAFAEHFALLERIEDAREAHRGEEENGGSLEAALARGGRSALAWVKELAVMSEAGGTGYRAAALPKETLWRIALDPAETEELRIGASLTLRSDLDEDGRARLRSAAEASASPRVRVALAGAADALDDEALGDAIAGRARAKHD